MSQKKKKRHSLDAEQKKLRDKQKHPLITHVCKHKEPIDKSLLRCNEIDKLMRVYTHSQFWEGSSDCRRNWINHMVEEKEPERQRKIKTDQVERGVSHTYHLYTGNGERLHVCQRLFLSTKLFSVRRKLNASPDKRGKKEPPNKLSADVKMICDHILLYNPCITHYRRQHAPNRLYISPMYSSHRF